MSVSGGDLAEMDGTFYMAGCGRQNERKGGKKKKNCGSPSDPQHFGGSPDDPQNLFSPEPRGLNSAPLTVKLGSRRGLTLIPTLPEIAAFCGRDPKVSACTSVDISSTDSSISCELCAQILALFHGLVRVTLACLSGGQRYGEVQARITRFFGCACDMISWYVACMQFFWHVVICSACVDARRSCHPLRSHTKREYPALL